MKMIYKISGYAAAAALAVLLTLSCRYNPLDSYSRIPPDRTEEEEDDKGGMDGAFASGFGTSESPYIISDAKHIANISKALYQGEMVYFKLSADIDMKDISWTPLNSKDPFDLFIDFDGDGHIIRNFSCKRQSYSSFFGVLCGECRNVGFVDAEVSGTNATGIIAGYLGIASPTSANFVGTIRNCYVGGSVSGTPAGGMVGKIGTAYSPYYCEIADSYSAAKVSSASGNCGGIAGEVLAGGVVSGCYASGDVLGGGYTGGIAGSLASSASLKDVVAWNSSLSGADGKTGLVNGNGTAFDGAYNWDKTSASIPNPDGKTTEELRVIVTGWGSPWTGSGGEADGYPAMEWLAARADIAEVCGQPILPTDITEGSGTASDPYLIGTAGQLFSLKSVLKSGETVYVKLTSDINLKKQNWTPLNNETPYDLGINFDGGGHIIRNLSCDGAESYQSFFGVLNGTCRDVEFADAEIISQAGSCGVLGGFAGTASGITADVADVRVSGSVTSAGASTGGLAGRAENATFTRCSVSLVISGKDKTGGMVGRSDSKVSLQDCIFSGSLTGTQFCGGIVGELPGNSSVRNCCVTATMKGWGTLGGIVGRAAAGRWIARDSGYADTVEACIVWTDNLTVTRPDADGGSSGAVVGFTGVKNTLKNCWRKAAMTLSANYCSDLYDQENADESTPLIIQGTPSGKNYIYPYHGKAAAAEDTASSVAQTLGWDSAVWDFSGATPSLRK